MALNGLLLTYLRRFSAVLRGFSRREARAPEHARTTEAPLTHLAPVVGIEIVDPVDVLSRFLFQKNQFKPNEGRATPEAFLPPPDLQLSTFVTTGIPPDEILRIGKDVLASHPRPRLYGHAELDLSNVHLQKLKAFRDDNPDRHVNVVGWPTYSDGKDRIKIIAQELAKTSRLVLQPTPIEKAT